MAQFRNQHFVPRSYLKYFSVDGAGRAINLYNISNNVCVPNAPVKGQCAKANFYGKDLAIEKALQHFESQYSRTLSKIYNRTSKISEEDLAGLRDFAYLQYSRTQAAVERMRKVHESQLEEIYIGRPMPPELKWEPEEVMISAMQMYINSKEYIRDLKACIIINTTRVDFVASDDPSILVSRFHSQKLKTNVYGIGSAGVILFLPMSPRIQLVCYDSAIYSANLSSKNVISATKEKDVIALNELQFLKANENIYFRNWENKEHIMNQYLKYSSERMKKWHHIQKFIKVEQGEGYEKFTPASGAEFAKSKANLIVLTHYNVELSLWFSGIRFRQKLAYRYDGSAAGYMRDKVWKTYRR